MGREVVAIVDGGGRCSALAEAYSRSGSVDAILAFPGNDLLPTVTHGLQVETYPDLKTTNVAEIVDACRRHAVTLVDVAQDNAVERGLVDALREAGIQAVGPTREAGRLEWDKAHAREFMRRHAIPHPAFHVCNSTEEGERFLQEHDDQPWVIKANGLAEGKGVVIARNRAEAIQAVRSMARFGDAGKTFLIEQFLDGEEFSSYAITDGKNHRMLGSAQDHKRLLDNDEGPNTGGMGCSAPPLVINSAIQEQIDGIFTKTFEGMRQDGTPYTGVLYLGGMVVNGQVFVIEYNARWGDPEAQVILPSILSNYLKLSRASVEGTIGEETLSTDRRSRVVVAGVSRGYPGDYSAVKGKRVHGLHMAREMPGVTVYGAGIRRERGLDYAAGGRLFYVAGVGDNVIQARVKVYAAMAGISVEGKNLAYRTDIGSRDVERLRSRNGH